MDKGEANMPKGQASSSETNKPRSRVVTGWRHVVPLPKGPKRKRPVAPAKPGTVPA